MSDDDHPNTRMPVRTQREFSFQKSDWHTVGVGPRSLVSMPSTITDYLGLGNLPTQRQSGEARYALKQP